MCLDLVIPAHNEELRISPTLTAYRDALGPHDHIYVALDRCTDGTADIVRSHAAVDSRVGLLNFPKLGKGGVIIEAFRHCQGEFVGFVDADGATPPDELLRLLAAASTPGIDGAIASRRHPTSISPAPRAPGRKVASAAFAFGVRRMFGLPFADTQCGAKVFRQEALYQCLPFLSSRDLLFDVDLLLTAFRLGFRIAEVPTVWIDKEGSKVDVVGDSRRMAMSSLRLWLHHRVLPVEFVLRATIPESDALTCVIDLTDKVVDELEHRAEIESQSQLADAHGAGA